MIKAVIFDCFGVLTTDLWRAFCDSLPGGEGLKRAHELNHAFDKGFITLEEYQQGVEEATGKRPPDIDALSQNNIVKNKQILDLIADLKRQGYKIGMLSNISNDWVKTHFLNKDEQSLFDDMLFSYEVGMIKPDERFFGLAAERLGVAPDEVVFTDDIASYCDGARAAGMKAIHYKNYQQFKTELSQLLHHA